MEPLDAYSVIAELKKLNPVNDESLAAFARWVEARDVEADGLETERDKLRADLTAARAHIAKLEQDLFRRTA